MKPLLLTAVLAASATAVFTDPQYQADYGSLIPIMNQVEAVAIMHEIGEPK